MASTYVLVMYYVPMSDNLVFTSVNAVFTYTPTYVLLMLCYGTFCVRCRPGSTRPATATTMLSSTMGMSDWTFIYPESTLAESSGEMAELNLPTLDDFDMQIAVFEV